MFILKHLRFSTQFLVVTVLAVLAMLLLASVNAFALKQSLLEERRKLTRSAVVMAQRVVESEAQRALRSGDSIDTAKERAIESLSNLRYGHNDNEYFFVLDFDTRMVANPRSAATVGQDRTTKQDHTGYRFNQAMIDIASSRGSGYVDYYWTRSEEIGPQRKVSFVQAYQPWQWAIVSGMYLDDIDAAFYKRLSISTAILMFSTILIIGFATLVVKNLKNDCKCIMARLKKMGAGGYDNMTQPAEETSRNELVL